MEPSIQVSHGALGHNISTLNIDYPSSSEIGSATAEDSAYVAWIAWSQDPAVTLTTPSGWTLVATSVSGTFSLALFWKVYNASVGSQNFVLSGAAGKLEGTIDLWIGVSTASPNPITLSSTAVTSPASTTHTLTSITTTVNNSAIIDAFMSPDTPAMFTSNSSHSAIYSGVSRSSTGGAGLCTFYTIKGTAGATGTVGANSFNGDTQQSYSVSSAQILASINPYQGPSAPTVVTPNGGESITVGLSYLITWLASTDPDTAQSSLTYAIDYSNNDGASWTSITAATSAGAVSHSWSTTGLTPGAQYRIRIRATDGTHTGPYDQSDNTFTIAADVTPGAPTNLSPNGTVFDRAAAKVFTWIFNDPGDIQTAYQIQASTDDFATTPIDTGTVVSGTASHSFAGSTFSHLNYKWRVRTKDNAGTFGPYSASATFLAGDKPAAPNITAPTAGSPPTTATPTHTWTSSVQVARKVRIETGGGEIYNSGKIVSDLVSIPSPINYANGVAYTLYVSVWNSDDLQSSEDSETFTPSYSAPATPTVTATAVADGGYIQITVANSDTPDHNELFRYVTSAGASSKIRICESLAVDGTFLDRDVKSGVDYSYIVRAVSAADLIADSSADNDTLTLAKFWLHLVTEDPVTSNGTLAIGIGQVAPEVFTQSYVSEQKRLKGRSKPITVFGQILSRQIAATFMISVSDTSTGAILESLFVANGIVCARDQFGNLIFGRLVSVPIQDSAALTLYQIAVVETDFEEEV